eukprot:TRINITY_DN9506_c0_g1_i1.p2 TRINITY_DN9506_c0_g1~~TRINITY_DN9506_c0_g1_i1.p2  ORF type:complete len:174 (-),score=31.66 TRINITY_DN9506_c0_g1_i1:72-593(-)
MRPFEHSGFSAREISCGVRDQDLYWGSGMVGYCGATPEEIVRVTGISNCNPCKDASPDWTNGFLGCAAEGFGTQHGCTPQGWTCEGYEIRGWCKDGQKTTGSFAFGKDMNYPERNCCACGGGTVGTCRPWTVRRRRRAGASLCACRRRSGYAGRGLHCRNDEIVEDAEHQVEG